jgi:hypothetical protein
MSYKREKMELVKEKMERDDKNRMDDEEEKNSKKIEIKWERMMNEKEKDVEEIEEKKKKKMDMIKKEIEMERKNRR